MPKITIKLKILWGLFGNKQFHSSLFLFFVLLYIIRRVKEETKIKEFPEIAGTLIYAYLKLK